jgi:hypothetical protein
MITIFDTTKLNGAKFNTTDGVEWICIGIGTPPDAGRPYVVGKRFESADNRTVVDTFPLSKVKFFGQI